MSHGNDTAARAVLKIGAMDNLKVRGDKTLRIDYKWSDLVGLALGGLLNLFGEPGRPPTRARASHAPRSSKR